ncbi:MAG TPA: ABC transporter substrate-binding protein [Stellaceae bacterium]|nr:ABC transporter substrate-binding protein [Stellaceae bacterium]
MRVLAAAAALVGAASNAQALDQIKIGVGKLSSTAPVLIAQDKGYFKAENLDASFVFFDAAQTITMGVSSGSLDFGVTAVSGAFYSLAAAGTIKLIAGTVRDEPGFQQYAFVISNKAYAAGFTSLKDMAGHSVAIVQIGGPIHYVLSLLEDKYKIAPASVRALPLQAIPNEVSAVAGNTADAGIIPATAATPPVTKGAMKLLGYTGDEVQWQAGGAFASTKMIKDNPKLVERFLRAFRKGLADYHAAYMGPDDKRKDGPTAPAITAIIAKYIGQTPQQIESSIPYLDAKGALDPKDIDHQLDWFRAQGMLKSNIKAADVIEQKYLVTR